MAPLSLRQASPSFTLDHLCCIGLSCALKHRAAFPSVPTDVNSSLLSHLAKFFLPGKTTHG